MAESEFSLQKVDVFSPKNLRGPIFMGVPPLTNNTANMSVGKDE